MNQSRRNFLQQSSLAGAGLLLTGSSVFAHPAPLANFGLQLYTLRDDLPKDPKGILKKIAGYGYTQIEGYEGKDGLWWGLGHKDFKTYLSDIGLKMVSSHCAWEDNLERKAAEAAEVGVKYLICPYLGAQKQLDDYKRFAAKFNTAGEICRKNGIRFAYHNHDYSFKMLEGQYPQAVMMDIADKQLVDFEMDMYWVVTANQDPITWMKKYINRFKLCHVKDRSKTVAEGNGDGSVVLGTGRIDYPKILKEAKKFGMAYFIVEQEKYDGTTPLQAVEDNAVYLKKLKV